MKTRMMMLAALIVLCAVPALGADACHDYCDKKYEFEEDFFVCKFACGSHAYRLLGGVKSGCGKPIEYAEQDYGPAAEDVTDENGTSSKCFDSIQLESAEQLYCFFAEDGIVDSVAVSYFNFKSQVERENFFEITFDTLKYLYGAPHLIKDTRQLLYKNPAMNENIFLSLSETGSVNIFFRFAE